MEETRNFNNMVSNTIDNNSCCSIYDSNKCIPNEMSRREMLRQIKCLKFAIVDIALYLNTHPQDERALCLHNKYCKDLKDLEDRYQKIYGPLSIFYPCNKWRWIEQPWPWEGGIN